MNNFAATFNKYVERIKEGKDTQASETALDQLISISDSTELKNTPEFIDSYIKKYKKTDAEYKAFKWVKKMVIKEIDYRNGKSFVF